MIKKTIHISALSLILIGLFSLSAIAVFLSSAQGLKITQALIIKVLQERGDTLVIQNSSGSLRNFSAAQISLKTPSLNFSLQNVHLSFSLLPLLWWEWRIQSFSADSLDIQIPSRVRSVASSSLSSKRRIFFNPPKISLQNFHLTDLLIHFPNGRQLKASLDIEKTQNLIQVKNFSLTYLPLRLRLETATPFQFTKQGLAWKNLCFVDNTQNEVCFDGSWKDTENFSLSSRLNLSHLSVLDDIFPELMDSSGNISGTLAVSKTYGISNFSGQILLKDGSTYLPLTGMHPEQLNASLSPENHALKLEASGQSGQGKFSINGFIFQAPELLTLSFQGEQINVLNLSEGSIDASPNLNYQWDGVSQSIKGSIALTHALINGDNLRSKAANYSDIVFISPSGVIEKEKSHLFSTEITVTLGDDAHFQGFGIQASLQGSLNIQSEPGQAITGTGTWTISQGQYETYGKKFSLKNGSLIFNHSPLSNPSLNVKAIYKLPQTFVRGMSSVSNPVELGVAVTGTVAFPKFNFFSVPPLSQTDILSYIVLGAPLSQASINQQDVIAQAAISYALNKGNFSFLEDLKTHLGIDSVNLGTLNPIDSESLLPQNNVNETDNTAVFIGKQISPRLYVTYGLGLFNQEQELKTQYLFSSHWSFLTNTATSGNGADFVYTLDR